jgi:uncharacterized protein (TIGR02117 family)
MSDFVSRRVLLLCCGCVLGIVSQGGCSDLPPAVPAPIVAGASEATLYVIDRGWHTDIGFPAKEVTGGLEVLTRGFPETRTLVIGFGERDYMLAADKGFIDMLRALAPGAGVVLVTRLSTTPVAAFGAGNVVTLRLSRDGLGRAMRFVLDDMEKDAAGRPRRIADGTDPDSVFYASSARYSGAYTCNTWAADALASAGLPVSASGVVFAGQLMDRARAVAR